jgi:hypothetical protein
MGELQMENYRFANREFLANSVDYLVSGTQLFETRNKDFVLRLLDKKKLSEEKTFWQAMNIGLPLILVLILGVFLQWRRKSKYSA